ncbi:transcription factor Tfb4 [Cristinia sonorae]|uniref:General transcription and DNA repair factor IIH subunit TFB4 n=1 Tax=Cristinia sonorae TaxID=1940300 RepID=A0A8K0UYB4_9AGAR|nr:transcription factor Tfb4 [Cristinia sonorae]
MDKASHLSVILDLSPVQWHLFGQSTNPFPLSLSSFLSQLLAFLNAHTACKDENTLAVFGAFPGKSVLLFSSTTGISEGDLGPADANTYRPFKMLDATIMKSILEELEELSGAQEESPLGLVGALTKALCYINRTSSAASSAPAARSEETNLPDPRILIISVSPDQPSAYIPIMNSIFSAQKLKVTIDVCKLFGSDSVFLQQASHLTGGSYIFLERPDALLQYLTMSFLPPPALRQLLSVPTQDKVDFRAACFCHKNIVDVGFVCSVCLSIFCQPVPVCSTCRTKFPIKTLQRLNASKPPAPTANRAAIPATSLPRSTSIGSGTPRLTPLSNGNGTVHPPSQNGTPR